MRNRSFVGSGFETSGSSLAFAFDGLSVQAAYGSRTKGNGAWWARSPLGFKIL
jgi:hypothetical protein